MANKHCIYAFQEDGQTYRRGIRGLRGKRRQAFKLAVARAATKADEIYAKTEKDKTIPKLLKLANTYHAKQQALTAKYQTAVAKLTKDYYEKAKDINTTIAHHTLNYRMDKPWLVSTIAEWEIQKLIQQVQGVGSALHDEQHAAAKADGQITECGVRLPRPVEAKKVLADPKLKALIDGVGASE